MSRSLLCRWLCIGFCLLFSSLPLVGQQVQGKKIATPTKEITNTIGMKLVYIPLGKFTMGSPVTEKDRTKQEKEHEVEITKGFYMGKFVVTQEEYENIVGTNPSWFSSRGGGKESVRGQDTRRFPVEQVSWNDAVKFCERLSTKENMTYRLPSEAECEYACRAGTRTPFNFGTADNGRKMNTNGNYPYGMEEKGTYLGRTCAVGNYPANAFGLHDMHGNVWQWCQDWYYEWYYSNSPRQDPQGPENGTRRVLRGGSWDSHPRSCRSANRGDNAPESRYRSNGFRVVLVGSISGPS